MFIPLLVVHVAVAAATAAALPITTEMKTTNLARFVPPQDFTGPFEAGLVIQQFFANSGSASVVAIDPSLQHWGKYVPQLALKWIGALHIKVPGSYRFQLTSLGMSQLTLDGRKILQLADKGNNNSTGMTPSLDMASGYHSLVVGYKETEGKTGCVLEYAGPDSSGTMQAVPAVALWHQRGPCSLQLPHAAKPPCSGPRRWALDDGERCEVRCLEGYFSSFSGGPMEMLQCKAGKLLPPGFVCGKRPCFAPQVALAKNPSCKEGAAVRRGGSCTPQCQIGYGASMSGAQSALQCDSDGRLLGYFICEQKRQCNMPVLAVVHGATPLCEGGGMIPHGAQCLARCQPGYAPSRNPICNDGVIQPASFECNLQPITAIVTTTVSTWTQTTATVTTSTQTTSTQTATTSTVTTQTATTSTVTTHTATTTTVIIALPPVLQELSVMTGQFINEAGNLDVSDLPRFWPILTAMLVLLLCLCLCLACLIRGSSSRRKRHDERQVSMVDSWASSEDESDTLLDSNSTAPLQHPHPTPRANERGIGMQMVSPSPQTVMENLNTEQRGRLEALRPRGLRQHAADRGVSFMSDSVTPPQQHLPDSPSFFGALLGSEAAGWGGTHNAGAHSTIPSQLQGFPWQDPLPADSLSPRILDSAWTPLAAVPVQVHEQDPFTWCDVRTEDNGPRNVAWSDVRIDE